MKLYWPLAFLMCGLIHSPALFAQESPVLQQGQPVGQEIFPGVPERKKKNQLRAAETRAADQAPKTGKGVIIGKDDFFSFREDDNSTKPETTRPATPGSNQKPDVINLFEE